MSNILELYRQYIGNPTAQAVGGFGRGMFGLEQPEYLQNELGREAYRTGQAVGNMPAVAAPVGAIKAVTQVPEAIGMLGTKASQLADMLPALGVVIGSKAKNSEMQQMFKDITDMKSLGQIQPDINKYIEKTHSAWRDPVTQRYMMELDDSIANFLPNTAFTEAIDKGYLGKKTLGEIFDHPKLFEAYPGLKDTEVTFVGTRNSSGENAGSFGTGANSQPTISIHGNSLEEARKTLLHEIQHYIQEAEGWPRGGSPSNMITGAAATRKANEAAKEIAALDPTRSWNAQPISFWKKKEDAYRLLAKYPSTSDGKYRAYRDLWGERQAETVADRADLSKAVRGPSFLQEMEVGQPPTLPFSQQGTYLYDSVAERTPFLNPLLQDSIGDTTR
jgi:hypothetical protein